MAESSIDVLMKVVSQKGPVPAESNTVFQRSTTPDPLRLGFNPGQICDLLSFEFAAGVEPAGKTFGEGEFNSEEVAKELARQAAKLARDQGKTKASDTHIIDMQPIRYTRIFDMASPILFQALVDCETLSSVAIIKRKAANTKNSGEAYLRLDFTKVLLTELDWEDKEHYVEETGSFIYRELKVQYRQQQANGSLGPPVAIDWKIQK
jgi:type VI secretion system Hcp family effector